MWKFKTKILELSSIYLYSIVDACSNVQSNLESVKLYFNTKVFCLEEQKEQIVRNKLKFKSFKQNFCWAANTINSNRTLSKCWNITAVQIETMIIITKKKTIIYYNIK